jgi:hypothetical protein
MKDLEMPVDRLLRRMNDPRLPEDYRDHLAALAAPYTAVRLSAVSVMKRPSQMSTQELEDAIQMAKEDVVRKGVEVGAWPQPVH